MRDFLTDFYNKVINFFQAEKTEGENTKETAKNRLKLVLMQDRSNLEPETMAQLREELIEVISKYIVIDKEALGLNLDGDGESMALMLNIPVIRAKKPEEIREALEEAKKKAQEAAEKTEEEKEETSDEQSEENTAEDTAEETKTIENAEEKEEQESEISEDEEKTDDDIIEETEETSEEKKTEETAETEKKEEKPQKNIKKNK